MAYERENCVSIDHMALFYREMGEGSSVILLHGMPTSSYLWRQVLPVLSGQVRALAPDLLGFGRSDAPSYRDWDISAQAGYVLSFMDALKIDRADIVGHDIGGGVAQIIAVQRPERVRRLVLVDSVCYDSWPAPELKRMADPTLDRTLNVEYLIGAVSTILEQMVADPAHLRGEVEHDYLAPWSNPFGLAAFLKQARSMDSGLTAALQDKLPKLSAPTLIVWGEQDRFLPRDLGERLHNDIPGAEYHLFAGVGHLVPEEAPEKLGNLILDFFHRR